VHHGQETYVAESNLEHDFSSEPVFHPLVERFFATHHDGRYYRQSRN